MRGLSSGRTLAGSLPVTFLCFLGPLLARADCPAIPTGRKCVSVRDYEDLRTQMEGVSNNGELCFKPFLISRDEKDTTIKLEDRKTHIWCEEPRKCTIKGEGAHILIKGKSAQVTLSGFTFIGSTQTAIKVIKWSGKSGKDQQKICDSLFDDCVTTRRGASIKIEDKTSVLIENCSFTDNKSNQQGGGIFNEGILYVNNCEFAGNYAHLGGALHNEDAYMHVSNTCFHQNSVKGRGPAIFNRDGELHDGGGNRGAGNKSITVSGVKGDCNGFYHETKTEECHKFDAECAVIVDDGDDFEEVMPLTESPVDPPTIPSPKSQPTLRPNQRPSPRPTPQPVLKPILMPTPRPTPRPTSRPSPRPTSIPIPRPTPRPQLDTSSSATTYRAAPVPRTKPRGYYNFDEEDKQYGPSNWKKLRAVDSYNYEFYNNFKDYLKTNLKSNFCNSGKRQSPIDLRYTAVNEECREYHQIRDMPGEVDINDKSVKVEIMPHALSIVYPKCPSNMDKSGMMQCPHLDMPKGWGHYYPAIKSEFITPSAHTIEGKQYDGEFTVYVMSDRGRGMTGVTNLVEIDTFQRDNKHFNRFIAAFFGIYQENHAACRKRRDRQRELRDNGMDGSNLTEPMIDYYQEPILNITTEYERLLSHVRSKDDQMFNVFHHDIMTDIYFWAYQGSILEYPCYPIMNWRVMSKPMKLSTRQLDILKRMLFTNVDPKTCVLTSVHGEGGTVARPLESNKGVDLHKCDCTDFYSDKVRKDTGQRDCR